jgi:hypothetical protein
MNESLELLDRTESIKEIANDTDRRKEIAKQYSTETLIITGTVQAREELNSQIRANLISKGLLNDKDGITYNMDIPNQEGQTECKRVRLTKGDKITFLQNEYRDYDIRNGERATITALNDRNIEVLTADGRKLTIDINKYRAIDYGYALTTYKSQGQTYDKVIVESDTKIPSLNDMRNQYVQITRARDKVTIYTDDKESLKELADLKTHSRDTLDEKITLQQAEKNKQQMENRIGEYVQDSMKSFKETPIATKLPERKQEIEPIRDITIHNEKRLNHLISDKWTYNYIQDKMNQTTQRLRERTDLTYKQKEAIAKLLNNNDDGEYIWTKKSLSPDGRIATAQLLLGERDREQILENISKPEIGVIKEVERHHDKSKSRERGRERGLER